MSSAQFITRDDLKSMKKHMHPKEWSVIETIIDALDIQDEDERNAVLALAVCEYELLAKPAAVRYEAAMRPCVQELYELYKASDFNNSEHLKAWINNAARIIHDSQAFIMYRHAENARMQEFYRGLMRDHGADESSEEAMVQIADVANQAEDFWAVLTKLRARTGMPAAQVDFTGYPIDPSDKLEADGQG